MSLNKNEIITLKIEGMTHDGNGVGKYNNQAVFVPQTAVGDVCKVKILKVEKTFAYGKIEEIIKASDTRQEQSCPVFQRCGGCSYRHINYEEELRIKREKVRDAFLRIAGYDCEINPVIGSDNISYYRNKAQYPVGRDINGNIITGFFSMRSHNIIDVTCCDIQHPASAQITDTFREWISKKQIPVYDEKSHTGILRHIYVRVSFGTGEIMVCAIINAESLPYGDELVSMLRERINGLTSVVININKSKTNIILGNRCKTLWGKGYITDILDGLKFNISPMSFYQVNPNQTIKLYRKAVEAAELSGSETVLDLYCGIGTISLFLARNAKKVYGVEIVPEAIQNAKENARLNNIDNTEFICGTAADAAEELKSKSIKPDVITVDPPRKGLEKELIATICDMSPERVVYISCDPATLARDVKCLAQNGYAVKTVQPFDMFPRTWHVETVVLMSRVKD